MNRTIHHGDWDYLNPAIFSFTAAARRELERLRAAFPGKTIEIGWGESVRVHRRDGTTIEDLGDRIMVGVGTPDEVTSDPAMILNLDGHDIEVFIPADVTSSHEPVIDVDSRGRLTLRG